MDKKEISRRILDFTLEIISLLTGEDYTIVKKISGGIPLINEQEELNMTLFMELPPLIHEQKVLELTHKMMELLTGEVPVRCQDVTASVSKENQEHIEGHKDLYMDTITEDPQLFRKPGSDSRSRILPEKCPRPLDSQDRPEEKLQEDHQMTNQGEVVTVIKLEDGEERMMGDPQENPSKISEGNVILSVDNKEEGEDIGQRSSGENLITCNVYSSPDLSCNPPSLEEPSPDQSQIVTTSPDLSHNPTKKPTSDQSQIVTTSTEQKGGKSFQCEECGQQFTKISNLYMHKSVHAGGKSCSRSERGKSFTKTSNPVTAKKIRPAEQPYPCSQCGIGFFSKSNLLVHQKSHTGGKPVTYSESAKRFTQKPSLFSREKSHTGGKPVTYSESAKRFAPKPNLFSREKSHTGGKPVTHSESAKRFAPKPNLVSREKIHTGEQPFICSQCGKGFFSKTNLLFHQKSHSG